VLAEPPLAARAPHTSVAAAQGTRFSLQPVTYDEAHPETRSYFVFDAQPGQTITNNVRVLNTGSAAGTARLYAVDSTTGQTSGTVFLSQADPRHDAGAWLSLAAQDVTLNSGQSQVVSFTLTIPTGVRPGQHVGGIVAEDTQLQTSEAEATGAKVAGLHVNVQTRTIVAVQVNLPGAAVQQLDISGVAPGGQNGNQVVTIGLHNSGDVMLQPKGSIQIADSRGQVLQDLPLTLDTLQPQTAINYPVNIQNQALDAGGLADPTRHWAGWPSARYSWY